MSSSGYLPSLPLTDDTLIADLTLKTPGLREVDRKGLQLWAIGTYCGQ